jgi:subtilisin-like proprotein convertase family protein
VFAVARGIAAVALLFCCVVVATSQAAAGEVSGRVEYVDRTFDVSGYTGTEVLPVRYAHVYLYDESLVEEIGSGVTDETGAYLFAIPQSGTRTARLVVSAETDSPWGSLVVKNTFSKSIHSLASDPASADARGNFTIDVEIPVDQGNNRIGDPFNIIDVLSEAERAVYDEEGEKVPLCIVYWADGSSDGTYYSAGVLHLVGGFPGDPTAGDNDGYDDSVVVHEYGHFLAERYSYDNTPGGGHSMKSYYIPTLTWSEGWANFWSSAARKSPVYWDATSGDKGFSVDFETGEPDSSVRIGMNNESAVAMVLYDIFDTALTHDGTVGEDDDPLGLGLKPIWQVFSGPMDNSELFATLLDFYEGWKSLYPKLDADSIFRERRIEFVPPDGERLYLKYPLNTEIPAKPSGPIGEILDIPAQNGETIRDLAVFVAIEHPSPVQLTVTLSHPDGTTVALYAMTAKSGANLIEWFGLGSYRSPAEPLSLFSGKPAGGTWYLHADNGSFYQTGSVKSWGLRIETQVSGTGPILMLY